MTERHELETSLKHLGGHNRDAHVHVQLWLSQQNVLRHKGEFLFKVFKTPRFGSNFLSPLVMWEHVQSLSYVPK